MQLLKQQALVTQPFGSKQVRRVAAIDRSCSALSTQWGQQAPSSVACRSGNVNINNLAPNVEPEGDAPATKPPKPSPNQKLSDDLNNTSITLLGDDPELMAEVCKALGKKIGWFPASTTKVLCGLLKASSIDDAVAKHGWDEVVDQEAGMLHGMRTQRRVINLPLPAGAVSRESTFKDLFGTYIIWIDEVDKRFPKPASPERALFRRHADIICEFSKPMGFGTTAIPVAEKAKKCVENIVGPMLRKHLDTYPEIPMKKRLYVELGCRGDWPNLQPADTKSFTPGWMDRKPVEADAPEQEQLQYIPGGQGTKGDAQQSQQ